MAQTGQRSGRVEKAVGGSNKPARHMTGLKGQIQGGTKEKKRQRVGKTGEKHGWNSRTGVEKQPARVESKAKRRVRKTTGQGTDVVREIAGVGWITPWRVRNITGLSRRSENTTGQGAIEDEGRGLKKLALGLTKTICPERKAGSKKACLRVQKAIRS